MWVGADVDGVASASGDQGRVRFLEAVGLLVFARRVRAVPQAAAGAGKPPSLSRRRRPSGLGSGPRPLPRGHGGGARGWSSAKGQRARG